MTPAFGGKGLRVSMKNPADGAETATSVYTYDATSQLWRQAWVNDAGHTITMEGGLVGESLALAVKTDSTGTAMDGRSLFSDVTRESFTYSWQTTKDEGKTWETVATRTFRRKA